MVTEEGADDEKSGSRSGLAMVEKSRCISSDTSDDTFKYLPGAD
jgi:hypothetical protein